MTSCARVAQELRESCARVAQEVRKRGTELRKRMSTHTRTPHHKAQRQLHKYRITKQQLHIQTTWHTCELVYLHKLVAQPSSQSEEKLNLLFTIAISCSVTPAITEPALKHNAIPQVFRMLLLVHHSLSAMLQFVTVKHH